MKSLKTAGLIIMFAITSVVSAKESSQPDAPQLKVYRIERSVSEDARECIECHAKESRGIVGDWANSRHAHANVTCLDCHAAGAGDVNASKHHLEYDKTSISAIVSPKDCSRCHPSEAAEYAKSKHANTREIIWKIDPWLNHGLNNATECATGCYYCHGTEVKIKNGKLDENTWPNVGVGRINPDGSKGSCSSCHTIHKFSLDEAIEIEMYELWYHEGRRARFGAAMMAPDYAWWHGFYEMKKRCMTIEELAEELLKSGKPAKIFKVKGATGSTSNPDPGK